MRAFRPTSRVIALCAVLATCLLSHCSKPTSTAVAAPAVADQASAATAAKLPAEDQPAPAAGLNPDAGDVRMSKTTGAITDEEIIITFPTDMVDQEFIGRPTQCPVVIEPAVDHSFRWITPQRGTMHIGAYDTPPVPHRITLRKDLQDKAGNAVQPDGWGAERKTDTFQINEVRIDRGLSGDEDQDQDRKLPVIAALPVVHLELTRNMLPADIAKQVKFIDSETRQHYAVRVAVDPKRQDVPQGLFDLEPAEPLPPDRTYWLVVERLKPSPADDTRYLRVYPAGHCMPMEPDRAQGYSQPRTGNFVRLTFTQPVDHGVPADLFDVKPPVAPLAVSVRRNVVTLAGPFEQERTYTITAKAGVTAVGGVATTEAKSWDIEMPERRAAVIFPVAYVAQRKSKGVDITFTHARTKELKWKLARVPEDQLEDVIAKLREFTALQTDNDGNRIRDPRDHMPRFAETTVLAETLKLPVVQEGVFPPAPSDAEVERRVQWQPPKSDTGPGGVYLLEAFGAGLNGRGCGNRCLISLTDWFVNYLSGPHMSGVRVSHMDTGKPVAGVRVRGEAGEAVTGADGLAVFPNHAAKRRGASSQVLVGDDPAVFQICASTPHRSIVDAMRDSPTGGSWLASPRPTRLPGDYYYGDEDGDDRKTKPRTGSILMTNGDVFKPGEVVKIYALVRDYANEDDQVPQPLAPDTKLFVRVDGDRLTKTDQPEDIALRLTPGGAAEGEWTLPPGVPPGPVDLRLMRELKKGQKSRDADEDPDDLKQLKTITRIVITDYKPPAFAVSLVAPPMSGEKAVMEVHSSFFHGAPNDSAEVTWTAEWVSGEWLNEEYTIDERPPSLKDPTGSLRRWMWQFKFDDRESKEGMARPRTRAQDFIRERGTARLDDKGVLRLESTCPFAAQGREHRARVFWVVEVRSKAGLTRRAATTQHIQFAPRALALDTSYSSDAEQFSVTTITPDDVEGAPGAHAEVEIFHRRMNTVKEKLSDTFLRYVNEPEFKSVWKQTVALPWSGSYTKMDHGDFVIVARPVDLPGAQQVSDSEYNQDGWSEGVIVDDYSLEVAGPTTPVTVGESIVLKVRTPFAGTIRATIETKDLIETLPLVPVPGTSAQINIPVSKECFPNAYVRLHFLSPAAADGLPAERFARWELTVKDPNRELAVTPRITSSLTQPGKKVSGVIEVRAGAAPVANAEVAIMAVDEAVLSLGNWQMPPLRSEFHPDRPHDLKLYGATGSEWRPGFYGPLSHFQKGYILGDGITALGRRFDLRKENSNPRPLWLAALRTGADGNAAFEVQVPDALTTYRLTAIAHSPTMQTGMGQSELQATKPLRVEPHLPPFVRAGDTLDLRCAVQQDTAASMPAEFHLQVSGGTPASHSQQLTLAKGVQQIISVPYVVPAGDGVLTVQFAVSGSGLADGEQVTLAILSPQIERTEIVSKTLAGGEAWDVPSSMPPAWRGVDGRVDVLLSGTHWLPKIFSFSPLATPSSPGLSDAIAAVFAPWIVEDLGAYLPGNGAPTLAAGGGVDADKLDAAAILRSQKFVRSTQAMLFADEERGWLPRFPGRKERDDLSTGFAVLAMNQAATTWARRLPPKPADKENSWRGRDEEDINSAPFRWSRSTRQRLYNWRHAVLGIAHEAWDQKPATPFVRALALCAETYAMSEGDSRKAPDIALDMYEHRDQLDFEGKCLLGIALSRLNPTDTPTAQEVQLLKEIENATPPTEPDPNTFGTPARANALRVIALERLRYDWDKIKKDEIDRLTAAFRESPSDLTSQEAIWQWQAALACMQIEAPAPIARSPLGKTDFTKSPNEVTVGWFGRTLAALASEFAQPITPGVEATWLLRATFRAPTPTPAGSAKLEMNRQVRNLSDAARTGAAAAPMRTGDYVLIEYAIKNDSTLQNIVLDEELPAGLESINPDLPSVKKAFGLSAKDSGKDAQLDHEEHHDHGVRLFFRKLEAGVNHYAILTQVRATGAFAWPAAQIAPQYDRRLSATTADGTLNAANDK